MKTVITCLCAALLLGGCRIYTKTEGQGIVYTTSGRIFCENNSGDCFEKYNTPTTETFWAFPADDHNFRRWEGCAYKELSSCQTTINQKSIDDDSEWTIKGVFEPRTPEVQSAQYTYNALGQRITKTVGGVTTIFQYDLNGQLIAELDASGHPLRQHIYLDGAPISVIERDTPDSDPIVYYVHTDHLSTPDLITNRNGNIVADFENTPFGEFFVNYSELDYNLGFPGQYYDRESGLHYNYFRYYDSGLGRYVQSDPIGLDGGLNTYGYVHSNPIIYIDPLGLKCVQTKRRGLRCTPDPGYPQASTGVFGCLVGCASYTTADSDTQLSYAATIGGGFLVCSPRREPPAEDCLIEDKYPNFYDPDNDNALNFSPSAGVKGAGIGFTVEDDRVCIAIGAFVGLPIPVSYSLGGASG